ncbi:RT0821/Lpp0805 family surface protein [Bauldia litoralis]|uniref:RT0821/Lpp0805 family surface protein n=1 Tax=Bauldia litoralis TaxID=665467 RepID=UPI003265EF8F
MLGPRPPYTGHRAPRQSSTAGDGTRQAPPFFRATVVAALLAAAAGCSPFGTTGVSDAIQTGSINASVPEKVDPSDWETMRLTVSVAPPEEAGRARAWTNPDTGSFGTLVPAAAVPGTGGMCRTFSATVNDLRGVRRYRGEACQRQAGDWQLTGVTPDDTKLL